MVTKQRTTDDTTMKTVRGLTIEDASREARAMFAESIAKLIEASSGTQDSGRPGPLFFPTGIELIQLTFKVGTEIDITLTIAGAKDAKTLPSPPATNENSSSSD
ncbi:hypothetical protein PQR71_06900 [Paraburkholderia fungorum]|uniref:hypothetical protein n=1 Tax=Paraburkholderia fungorum TaxID=134537 RepID=UPI0038B9DD58